MTTRRQAWWQRLFALDSERRDCSACAKRPSSWPSTSKLRSQLSIASTCTGRPGFPCTYGTAWS
eukprot:1328982-Pleurochrysis_carterae.AAC.1